tara:strand:+ start:605 stop:1042 length:438 start_codon:yes stop_codon:yes gene_type:complete
LQWPCIAGWFDNAFWPWFGRFETFPASATVGVGQFSGGWAAAVRVMVFLVNSAGNAPSFAVCAVGVGHRTASIRFCPECIVPWVYFIRDLSIIVVGVGKFTLEVGHSKDEPSLSDVRCAEFFRCVQVCRRPVTQAFQVAEDIVEN